MWKQIIDNYIKSLENEFLAIWAGRQRGVLMDEQTRKRGECMYMCFGFIAIIYCLFEGGIWEFLLKVAPWGGHVLQRGR